LLREWFFQNIYFEKLKKKKNVRLINGLDYFTQRRDLKNYPRNG